jgi:hypothetical protein
MEALAFVCWLIPGYILYWHWIRVAQTRHPDSWKLILPVSLLSMFLFFIVRLLTIATRAFASETINLSSNWWKNDVINMQYSATFSACCVAALIFGQILFWITPLIMDSGTQNPTKTYPRILILFLQKIFKSFGYAEFENDFQQLIYNLAGKRCVITFASGRIYQGRIITPTNNLVGGIFSIRPIWSGHRIDGTGTVLYDTFYPETSPTEQDKTIELNPRITFPLKQVTSIAEYNETLDKLFEETGKSLYRVGTGYLENPS